MVDQTRERVGMSMADWERRWQDGPFELIDGEVIEVPPHPRQHILLKKLFLRALFALENAGVGQVFSEATYAQTTGTNWVKGSHIPDVMFYLQARWDEYMLTETPKSETDPLTLRPDVVVEVISPTDLYLNLDIKIAEYRAEGVPIIWVVNPRRRIIIVWNSDGNRLELSGADLLTDPLLPGFSLPLDQIFIAKKAR